MPKETKGDSSPYLKCPNLGFRNAEARTSLGRELPVAPTLKPEAAALKLLALTTAATPMRSAILRIPQEHVTSAVVMSMMGWDGAAEDHDISRPAEEWR